MGFTSKKHLADIGSLLKAKETCETPDIPAIAGLVLADRFVSAGIFSPLDFLNQVFVGNKY